VHGFLRLPQGNRQQLAALVVGEEQYPLETRQPPERRHDVFHHGAAKLLQALGTTFIRGYPREHTTSFPLAHRAVSYYTPDMMTPKQTRFIIRAQNWPPL
jgi:hypothetical protein